MADIDDVQGFDLSIGGCISNGWMNFGSDPKKVEEWQIYCLLTEMMQQSERLLLMVISMKNTVENR